MAQQWRDYRPPLRPKVCPRLRTQTQHLSYVPWALRIYVSFGRALCVLIELKRLHSKDSPDNAFPSRGVVMHGAR